jgi:hypothetical protein
VAIGGEYLGIYPRASPGGWRIVGRTSLAMFDDASQSSLLHPGDRVRLVRSTDSAFAVVPPPLAAALPRLAVVDPGSFHVGVQRAAGSGLPDRAGLMGIPRAGAADDLSHRIGNRLVNNTDDAPSLELTHLGGTKPAVLRVVEPSRLAITGAASDACALDDHPAPSWGGFLAGAGRTLIVPPPPATVGCRIYVSAGPDRTPPATSPRLDAMAVSDTRRVLSRRVLRITQGPQWNDSRRESEPCSSRPSSHSQREAIARGFASRRDLMPIPACTARCARRPCCLA